MAGTFIDVLSGLRFSEDWLKLFFSILAARRTRRRHVLFADGSRRRTIYFCDTSGYSQLRFDCAECIGCHRRSRNKPSITDELIWRRTLDVRYFLAPSVEGARGSFRQPLSSSRFSRLHHRQSLINSWTLSHLRGAIKTTKLKYRFSSRACQTETRRRRRVARRICILFFFF